MLLLGALLSTFQLPFVYKQIKILTWILSGLLGWLIGSVGSLFFWGEFSACRIVDSPLKFLVMGCAGFLGAVGIAIAQYISFRCRGEKSIKNFVRLVSFYGIGGFLASEFGALNIHLTFYYLLNFDLCLLFVSCISFGVTTAIAIKPFIINPD